MADFVPCDRLLKKAYCEENPEKFRTSKGFESVTSPVRRSNQLSYEDTDVGSWSFVGSYVPVINKSTN